MIVMQQVPSFFSVVIPLFNKESSVGRAISSVLSQEFKELELWVVDDGSEDDSFAVASKFQDPRLNVYRQTNAGVSRARNRGIKLATADYLCFLDADDAWDPWHLTEVMRLIESYPDFGLYSVAHRIVESDGSDLIRRIPFTSDACLSAREFFSVYPRFELVNSSTACARKQLLLEIGGFPEQATRGEDIYTWMRLVDRGGFTFSSRPSVTVFRNAENRSNERPLDGVPFHISSFLGADAAELREENRATAISAILRNTMFQAVGAARQKDYAALREMAAAARGHSLVISLFVRLCRLVPGPAWTFFKKVKDIRGGW
ncbi:glycosyltransferase family A protein [Thioalkalivibrio sp. XN279]|uniref:glycosyltransferase family 2 protein n=1 Tax=Thioalkalivibrio sp. XN279 TaxID=2714953 RepID=UPI00140A9225|nr:glycosyltransferase family A protein [Thioalkalivibrio sp. XN279]NHA15451.1 glycosyltransferase family 2 protein [Thioalkalivibrio sp. XN279]